MAFGRRLVDKEDSFLGLGTVLLIETLRLRYGVEVSPLYPPKRLKSSPWAPLEQRFLKAPG